MNKPHKTRKPYPTNPIAAIHLLLEYVWENLERTRRFETRFTKYLLAKGIDPPSRERPTWNATDECVEIPSLKVTLAEVFNVIPDEVGREDIEVRHRGQPECWIVVGP